MVYSIENYGAQQGGTELCTNAIQSAIDDCAAHGGGRVVIPAGTYKIGSLFLRSHVELHLEHGALLIASDDLGDYNPDDAYPGNHASVLKEGWTAQHLIIAYDCEDVSITGDGTIDGNGHAFYGEPAPGRPYVWMDGFRLSKAPSYKRPGQAIVFIECTKVCVKDITIRNVTCWSLWLYGCNVAAVTGVHIFNDKDCANTDGIDIDCSSFVTVSDCIFDTGDDAIAIRGAGGYLRKTKEKACEYVTVTNCVLGCSASGVRIGVGRGVIQHIQLSHLVVHHSGPVLNILSDWNTGVGTKIRDIDISDVTAYDATFPIRITSNEFGSVRDVSIKNFTAQASAALIVSGARGSLSGINLKNVNVRYKDLPMELTEEALSLRRMTPAVFEEVQGLRVDGMKLECLDDTWDGMIRLRHCEGAVLNGLVIGKEASSQDCTPAAQAAAPY